MGLIFLTGGLAVAAFFTPPDAPIGSWPRISIPNQCRARIYHTDRDAEAVGGWFGRRRQWLGTGKQIGESAVGVAAGNTAGDAARARWAGVAWGKSVNDDWREPWNGARRVEVAVVQFGDAVRGRARG